MGKFYFKKLFEPPCLLHQTIEIQQYIWHTFLSPRKTDTKIANCYHITQYTQLYRITSACSAWEKHYPAILTQYCNVRTCRYCYDINALWLELGNNCFCINRRCCCLSQEAVSQRLQSIIMLQCVSPSAAAL